jgi:NADPH:quinone reductase-like Zn-dependent oxidoreductase
MKALVCSELGNPTKSPGLQVKNDVPAPEPELSAGLVRIHVVAASLNFADVLVVQAGSQYGDLGKSSIEGKLNEDGRGSCCKPPP